jgi:hypothetical protein
MYDYLLWIKKSKQKKKNWFFPLYSKNDSIKSLENFF